MAELNSGVYQIVNLINNKKYIGSSGDLKRRKDKHFSCLRNNNSYNKYFQNSFNKYGENSFEFQILLYCDPENLAFYEQLLLDNWDKSNLYNLSPTAFFNTGYTHTQKSIKNMSKAQRGKIFTDEHRQNISESKKGIPGPFKGLKFSNEHKQSLSKAMKGRPSWNKGLKMPKEHNKKISNAKKGKKAWSKLNSEAVKVIKFMLKYHNYRGMQKKLAEMYKVTKGTIKHINAERTWKEIEV